jgi:chemotaxis protein CheD
VSASAVGRATPVEGADAVPRYIHPGHVLVSTSHAPMATILGSCVAVCLHDPVAKVGGMNHFLLPTAGADGESTSRYAPEAMSALIRGMLAHGARPGRLVATVIGGASVLAAFAGANHLGQRNVAAALEILAARRIPVVASDVGGTRGRKVVFQPRDGTQTIQLIGR